MLSYSVCGFNQTTLDRARQSGDIRFLSLKDGKYPVQYIPEQFLRYLRPVFHVFRLYIATIPIIVKPIRQPDGIAVNAKSRGWVIVVDPSYLRNGATDLALLGTLAHEGTHIVQRLRLGMGSPADNARWRADEVRWGTYAQYTVPDALAQITLENLNPIDPRFALEAIANRVKDIAIRATGRLGD